VLLPQDAWVFEATHLLEQSSPLEKSPGEDFHQTKLHTTKLQVQLD